MSSNTPIQHAGHSSLLSRLQNRFNQFGFSSKFGAPKKKDPPSRQVIISNRWDDAAWQRAREMEIIEEDIQDLYVGDLDAIARGEEDARQGYENAPELIRDLWQMLYKPYAKMRPRKQILKDAWFNRKILEELEKNPQFELLRQKCAMDAVSSTMAADAMCDAIREILTRKGDARDDSNQRRRESDQGGGQQGGGGGGQGDQQGDSGGGGGGKGGKGKGKNNKSDKDEDGQDQDDQEEKSEDEENQDDSEDQQDSEGDQDQDGEGDGKGQGNEPDQDDWGGGADDQENSEDDSDSDGDGDEDNDLIDDVERAWDDALEEAAEREDNERLAELLGDDDDAALERALNRAVDAATDEIGELEQIRRGIGLEDGEWQMMDPMKRFEYAERFRTPAMRDLADIVGRMIRFAMGCQATKIVDVPHEIYDVGNGDDITQALQSELGLLAGGEEAELLFFQRMVDKEMLVYKKRGTENAGKGPIVMVIDKSGSMSGAPFNWAMAVSEALRRICAEQDRDFFVLFFGNNNDRHRFWFPKGKPQHSFDEVLAFLSCVANGGTQFDGVLEEALQRVTSQFDEEGKGKADIVFVTDGQAHLDDEWIKRYNDERERIGCKQYAVFVGGASDYYGHRSTMVDFLHRFSDEVIPISEFKPESVSGIFSRV